MEETVYCNPNNVQCPTCNAPAGEPCQYLNGSGYMSGAWHNARNNVEEE